MKLWFLWCGVAIQLMGASGCSSDTGASGDGTGTQSDSDSDTTTNSNSGSDTSSHSDTDTNIDTNDPCEPPDMLIVLDHTESMAKQPSGVMTPQEQHELSKWFLAIDAIETVTAKYESRLRFGLELFPRNPGGGKCVTLTERISGENSTNTQCEQGEVIIPAALNNAGEIDAALDPETTELCISTPIGKAVDTAIEYLATIQTDGRPQYALMLTDGRNTCDDVNPVNRVQALTAAGVSTFVVGFDGSGKGIDPATLNNMACAGKTAPAFSTNCQDAGGGAYEAVDPEGATLFLAASNGQELTTKLGSVAALVGCGPV
ncbi:MAG: VWA domain-containing protein [Myxococcota bacterium]|nr:VWA domain-containing protein [Myxococcota bacterium]